MVGWHAFRGRLVYTLGIVFTAPLARFVAVTADLGGTAGVAGLGDASSDVLSMAVCLSVGVQVDGGVMAGERVAGLLVQPRTK